MSEVLRERDTEKQCFSTIRLDSGDCVMISIADRDAKIFKMRWKGTLPAGTLWAHSDLAGLARLLRDPARPDATLLENLRNRVLGCGSIEGVVADLNDLK